MTDPMQLLEMPLDVVEPPAAFGAELRARLLADLGAPRRRRRVRVGIAAAAAAAAALAGLVALPGDGGDDAGLVVVAVTPTPQPGDGALPSLGAVATPAAGPQVGPAASRPSAPAAVAGPARTGAGASARPGRAPVAGPRLDALSYSDIAHDGYAPYTVSDGNPRQEVSDPAVDLLEVRFVPLGQRHFRVTLTLGAAPKAATQYIAESDLSDGCHVYWMMTPGTLAEWILFCGAPVPRTEASGKQGRVTVEGATISAEFDLTDEETTPAVLYDAPVLGHSFSRACPDTGSCTNELTYDEAKAPPDAQFRWR